MSSSEWKDYQGSLTGKTYRDVVGWVDDYDRRLLTGKYFLQLDLDPPEVADSLWDVQFEIPKSEDRKHGGDEKVIFSGKIAAVNCTVRCTLDLGEVTYAAASIASGGNTTPPTAENSAPAATATEVQEADDPGVAATGTAAANATNVAREASIAAGETATAKAIPTETPQPSFGSTVSLNDWTISLAKMESRDKIVWSEFGNAYKPSGKFWLVWIDAKNEKNETRGIADDFDFYLYDDHGADYGELTSANSYSLNMFARLQGRDELDAGVTPRAVTHPLLVFDVAADALPAELLIRESGFLAFDEVRFNLSRN